MDSLKSHRDFWARVARDNGWYCEPFHVIVFVDEKGEVVDSVSHQGLERDMIVPL